MRMPRFTALLLAALLPALALAQTTGNNGAGSGVRVSGSITSGNCTKWLNSTTIADFGSPCGGTGAPASPAFGIGYNNSGSWGSLLPGATGSYCLNWSSLSAAPTLTSCSGGGGSFSAITSGNNTAAAMVVGSGASLGATGTGTISATQIGSAIYVPPQSGADTAINAAITSLNAAGGGTVLLGAGTYTLANPIVPKSGVSISGQLAELNYTTSTAPIPDSNLVLANAGGTIINCGGGACIQWNKTALGTPSSGNAFVIAGITNAAISNLGFTNCTRAVDAGNTNNPAGWYLEFSNLYVAGCSDWGFWITNFQHAKFRRIFTFANVNGGQYYGNDVPQSILQPGNSTWEDIYNTTPSTNANLSQGLVWFVVQGQQNQGQLYRIQSNRLNSSVITQAATLSNGSANIGVTDVSKFPVGMPCTFSASVDGVFVNEIYFVVSNPGGSGAGNITVSLTYGGTAVTGTGSTAVNIIEQGYPAVSVIANPGAALSAHEYYDLDVEAGGTAAIVAQNVQTSTFNISQVPLAAQSTQSFAARSLTFSTVFSRASSNTSWDGGSGSTCFYGNRAAGSVGGGAVAHNPCGIYYDAGLGYTVMNLTASVYGWSNQTPDSSNMLIPKTGMVSQQESKSAATVTLVGSDSGWVVDNYSTGSSTITLPTVSTTVKGMQYWLVNPVGTGQNLVATSGSNFCGPSTGTTSITMTPGSAMGVAAESDSLGTYYTCGPVLGSYSSGTLTGIAAGGGGGGSGTPGGSSTQVQYNNAGAFGGISNGTAGQVMTSNGPSTAPSFQSGVALNSLPASTALASGDLLLDYSQADAQAEAPTLAQLQTFVLGNGFTQFTGPTTSAKTFTLPNASSTILTTNAAVTVPQGGTGIASGTSGGVPYFSSSTTIASSAALPANALVVGGGAGIAPSTTTVLNNGSIVVRVNPREQTAANATSITPTGDTADIVVQANTQTAGTLTVNAPTGTPVDGQKLILRIQSTNVQTFAWNAIYRGSSTAALPTASTGSTKTDYFAFIYNTTSSTWDYVSSVAGF